MMMIMITYNNDINIKNYNNNDNNNNSGQMLFIGNYNRLYAHMPTKPIRPISTDTSRKWGVL